MAQLAYHVSMGLPLWDKPVQQGTVLYLALEDPYERLQHRLSTMFDVEGTDNLYFASSAKQVRAGLEAQLQTFLDNHPDTNLVIIDTLKKVRESGKESSYDRDYDFVEPIKKIGDAYKICILIVHHTRKQDASDTMEKISGTNGLSGAADGAFVMYKPNRLEASAILEVYGRDQADQKITLRRDMERLYWNWESAEMDDFAEKPDPILMTLDAFLTPEVANWTGTATELVEVLELDIKPNKLTMKLNVNCSRLKNDYQIHYKCTRKRTGRTITLHREPSPKVDDCDDGDGRDDKIDPQGLSS